MFSYVPRTILARVELRWTSIRLLGAQLGCVVLERYVLGGLHLGLADCDATIYADLGSKSQQEVGALVTRV